MGVLEFLVHIFIGKSPCTTLQLIFKFWSIIVRPTSSHLFPTLPTFSHLFFFFMINKSCNLFKFVSVLISASVKRVGVSRMRDFLYYHFEKRLEKTDTLKKTWPFKPIQTNSPRCLSSNKCVQFLLLIKSWVFLATLIINKKKSIVWVQ